jgi:dihydrofolate synthase/folylpolyglutamate synthase
MNAALAVAMLRHQDAVAVRDSALRAAMGWAEWPARLQRLAAGPLHALLPAGTELWLDGGHNPAAARAIADFFRAHVPAGRPFHIIFGLLENKDAPGVLKPFRNRAITLHPIPVPGHAHHSPAALASVGREAAMSAVPADDCRKRLRLDRPPCRSRRAADRADPRLALPCGRSPQEERSGADLIH